MKEKNAKSTPIGRNSTPHLLLLSMNMFGTARADSALPCVMASHFSFTRFSQGRSWSVFDTIACVCLSEAFKLRL
jgi:hypothetical protein